MKKFVSIAILSAILLLGSSIFFTSNVPNLLPTSASLSIEQNQTLTEGIPAVDLPLQTSNLSSTYNITIDVWIMMGASFNETKFMENLPSWYAPIERYPTSYSPSVIYDMNYTINYNLTYFTTQDILAYRNFLYVNAHIDASPYFLDGINETARYIPSAIVEDYFESLNVLRPTLVFLDTYTIDPTNFHYYYYNISSLDLDGYSNPRPYGATYQISGGGEKIPLLWFDYSAGPSEYRDEGYSFITSFDSESLAENMAFRLQKAIELRFVPSYLYEPLFAYERVIFEFLLVNLDNSSFDYFSKIDAEYLMDQYSRLNPAIDWQFRLSEWDYSQDSVFMAVLDSARNDTTHRYDGDMILNHLDSVYSSLFNSSSDGELVFPVFLFAFPDDWMFDSFLGIANNIDGKFAYAVSATNRNYANPTIDLYYPNWFVGTSSSLPSGYYTYIYAYAGSYNEIFEVNLESNQALSVIVLDNDGFAQYSSSKPFVPLAYYNGTNLSFNVSVHIWQQYYFIIENSGSGTATYNISINIFRDRSFGFSFVSLHEVGHGLGLSHPHDGWSWIDYQNYGYGEFLDWQWDLSHTPMTYAHHVPTFSILEVRHYQRSIAPKLFFDLSSRYDQVRTELLSQTQYVSHDVYNAATDFVTLMLDVVNEYPEFVEGNVPTEELPAVIQALYNAYSNLTVVESFDPTVNSAITVTNGNPEDYRIVVTNTWNNETIANSTNVETIPIDVTWVVLDVRVIRLADGHERSVTLNSWESLEINLDWLFPVETTSVASNTSATTTTQTHTSITISNNVSTTNLTSSPTSPAFLPLHLTPIFVGILIAVAFHKVKSKKFSLISMT